MAIRDALTKKRRAPTVPLDVPVRESKSNGNMERAIRTWQSMFRTFKESLQEKIQCDVPINTTVAEWMSWWAVELINRTKKMKKKKYGRTPY